jgi:hypothetical protein
MILNLPDRILKQLTTLFTSVDFDLKTKPKLQILTLIIFKQKEPTTTQRAKKK